MISSCTAPPPMIETEFQMNSEFKYLFDARGH